MAAGSPSLVGLALALVGYLALYQGAFDFALLVGLCGVRSGRLIQQLLGTQFLGYLFRTAGAVTAAFAFFQASRIFWTRSEAPRWTGFGKVLLFPCRTTHTRMAPKKHSFSHSYLVVGIPVGWEGAAGGLVSVGGKEDNSKGIMSWVSWNRSPGKAWYDTNATDYLERGKAHLGLRGKLDEFLKTQGADPASFPHAYLITAARFLGYHFNPVSFWYLYDSDKRLAAMILEVNSTFDERRMYFLTRGDEGSTDRIEGPTTSDQAGAPGKLPPRTVLRRVWPKDFHVSPFNSRDGSYSLVAGDPLGPYQPGSRPIDNTITLKSSTGPGKIVARLFSDGPPIDPTALTRLQKFQFLASWWWVGLVTFPRIIREAWVLFFRRRLSVWYRPEPLKESIGRRADSTERRLEPVFRNYLRHLVQSSELPVAVRYIPSGLAENAEEVMEPPSVRNLAPGMQELKFKILTPVFYSRFAYYAHDIEAIFCELRESSTIWISHPELIPKLFLKPPSPTLKTCNYVDFAYFKAIQRLRRRPQRIEQPLTSGAAPTARLRGNGNDIRDFRISSMDAYVLAKEDSETRTIYRTTVLKLFIADRVAFGIVPLLEAQRLLVQASMVWIISSVVSQPTKHEPW